MTHVNLIGEFVIGLNSSDIGINEDGSNIGFFQSLESLRSCIPYESLFHTKIVANLPE